MIHISLEISEAFSCEVLNVSYSPQVKQKKRKYIIKEVLFIFLSWQKSIFQCLFFFSYKVNMNIYSLILNPICSMRPPASDIIAHNLGGNAQHSFLELPIWQHREKVYTDNHTGNNSK